MDPDKLVEVAQKEKILPNIQRLGFILDLVGFENLSTKLNDWLKKNKPPKTVLDPGKEYRNSDLNSKWHIYANADIETDLL
jgi:hypothetical protein